tara:strand:+ start:67 stop:555 length:489 start_codon:yes stop_codon:yes gene_type:complete
MIPKKLILFFMINLRITSSMSVEPEDSIVVAVLNPVIPVPIQIGHPANDNVTKVIRGVPLKPTWSYVLLGYLGVFTILLMYLCSILLLFGLMLLPFSPFVKMVSPLAFDIWGCSSLAVILFGGCIVHPLLIVLAEHHEGVDNALRMGMARTLSNSIFRVVLG